MNSLYARPPFHTFAPRIEENVGLGQLMPILDLLLLLLLELDLEVNAPLAHDGVGRELEGQGHGVTGDVRDPWPVLVGDGLLVVEAVHGAGSVRGARVVT